MDMGCEYFLNLKPQEELRSTLQSMSDDSVDGCKFNVDEHDTSGQSLILNCPTSFGMLIRDTAPDLADLNSGGGRLLKLLQSPTECQLVALYLPCAVSELSEHVYGDLQ